MSSDDFTFFRGPEFVTRTCLTNNMERSSRKQILSSTMFIENIINMNDSE